MTRWIVAGLAVGLAVAVHPNTAAAQGKGDRYLLTVEEIQSRQDITNAYEAVQRLRSQWLKTARSRGSLGGTGSSAQATQSGGRPAPERPGAEGGGASSPGDPMARVGPNRGKVSPVLYIDEVKQDDIEELRNIRIAEIAEIRYMNGTSATGRYGEGHEAGAILLKTNRLGR